MWDRPFAGDVLQTLARAAQLDKGLAASARLDPRRDFAPGRELALDPCSASLRPVSVPVHAPAGVT
jgi:hypothetical protein